jgi:cytochrome c oxidase cbb3-type subunit 1
MIALELVFPQLNADLPWLSFNRLRPLHTNSVIFGFTLAGVFTTWYYVSQRVLKVRMVLPAVGKLHVKLYEVLLTLSLIKLEL